MDLSSIVKPTLILDESKARANLVRMAEKARRLGVRFRPHFKTHQSAQMGEWFRQAGVRAITVSSVDMADYFADAGWEDILIAFTANPRQVGAFDELAGRLHLECLVESPETVAFLQDRMRHAVDAWIKVDVGNHRTGIPVDEHARILDLARRLRGSRLNFRGLLTHAGQTYHTHGVDEILDIYRGCVEKMVRAREALVSAGFPHAELSYGDTPSCTLAQDFSGLDEIRPGNFIFYDLMQLQLQVCEPAQIAVAVACPVVAKHAETVGAKPSYRLVLYGGAVHLSKESVTIDGEPVYGALAPLTPAGWGVPLPGAHLYSLSQEHGLARVSPQVAADIQVGDLVGVLPVHSCLTVDLYSEYLTTNGGRIGIKQ